MRYSEKDIEEIITDIFEYEFNIYLAEKHGYF